MLRVGLLITSAFFLVAQTPAQLGLSGRILGPDGKPFRGAVVALVPASMSSGLTPVPEQRSGAKGEFALKAVAGRYGLTVTAPGCLPHFRNLDLKADAPTLPLDIRMEKGGHRIMGRIISVPGIKLEATRLGFSKVSQDSGDQFFGVVKQGRFNITLAPGAYIVDVEAKGQIGQQHIELRGDDQNAMIKLKAQPHPADAATLAWIKRNAIPIRGVEAGKGFADMQPLKALVGDATVVALGEATHGTREFFQMKHRMLEFLATEMGFTVFAIEANLPEAFAVDDYVLTGKGDPAKALAGLYFWTWNTEEVLDMIRWMRHWLPPTFRSWPSTCGHVPLLAAELKEPVNLGFETGLTGWSDIEYPGYKAMVVGLGAKEGTQSLRVAFEGAPNPNAWWKAEQVVDAASYRGKKVRFTGWIRTDGKPDFKARFWMRVDGKNDREFYDNMEQRPVTASEWTEVTIEGPVAEDAVNLTFGCTVMGVGTAWFDGIRVEIVP